MKKVPIYIQYLNDNSIDDSDLYIVKYLESKEDYDHVLIINIVNDIDSELDNLSKRTQLEHYYNSPKIKICDLNINDDLDTFINDYKLKNDCDCCVYFNKLEENNIKCTTTHIYINPDTISHASNLQIESTDLSSRENPPDASYSTSGSYLATCNGKQVLRQTFSVSGEGPAKTLPYELRPFECTGSLPYNEGYTYQVDSVDDEVIGETVTASGGVVTVTIQCSNHGNQMQTGWWPGHYECVFTLTTW